MNKIYTFGIIVLLALFGFWFLNQSKTSVSASSSGNDLIPVVNGQQIVSMTASAGGYTPNHFKIKAGIPVVWNITSSGNAGCASAVVAPQLFPDRIVLTADAVTTKQFTAPSPGTYRFSCTMGMYTGSFEVIN